MEPRVVVRPRDTDELIATVQVARETGTPVTMRGAGTSIAGNAIGPGIVVDTKRHLNRVLALDAEARVAHVQPGVVHAALQQQAVRAGLRFGPDPSTHTRCTIGGMIGNNACGSRALGYGRTVDNVETMRVLLADGRVVDGRATGRAGSPRRREPRARPHRVRPIRHGRCRGYSFEHLLPEKDRRFDRFLVGSEGTLGVVLDATVRLVEDAPARALAVLAYDDMAAAADAVPMLLEHDSSRARAWRSGSQPWCRATRSCPTGGGWLFAEVTGASEQEAGARAQAVAGPPASRTAS